MSPIQVASGPFPHVLRWVMRPILVDNLDFDLKCMVCDRYFTSWGLTSTASAKFQFAMLVSNFTRGEAQVAAVIGDEMCPGRSADDQGLDA